jgi:hypothetical protein
MNIVEHIQHRTIMGAALEIINNHNTAANAPYHNNHHMVGVQCITEGLWRLEKEDLGLENVRPEVALTVAALLHDIDHTAGTEPDTINVYRARACLRFHQDTLITAGLSPEELDVAENAIRCTVFPFTIEPSNKLEMILRDADVLYACYVADPKIILEGLRAEIEQSQKRDISYEEMLEGQRNFMKTTKLYTPTGQKLWDQFAGKYIVAMEDYVKHIKEACVEAH